MKTQNILLFSIVLFLSACNGYTKEEVKKMVDEATDRTIDSLTLVYAHCNDSSRYSSQESEGGGKLIADEVAIDYIDRYEPDPTGIRKYFISKKAVDDIFGNGSVNTLILNFAKGPDDRVAMILNGGIWEKTGVVRPENGVTTDQSPMYMVEAMCPSECDISLPN
jgi:hypothetical protein